MEAADGLTPEQRARISAEEGQRRLSYLYQATTTLFSEPLEVTRRLHVLTRLLVPDLGDWCWIDLDDGVRLRRVVTYHWDAARLEATPDGPRELAPDRTITLPMRELERGIGQVTLGFVESNRTYRPEDTALATELVVRAGWALDAARQYERATQATSAREDILAVVAHDLRNPLATVVMAASILQQAKLASEDKLMVDRIARAGDRMEKLVRDLLDWAAIESGRLAVECARVPVSTLIDEASDLFAVSGRDPRVVIEPPDEAVRAVKLLCDPSRTAQVFSNLIGNASKFAAKGTEIRVRTVLEPAFVRFVVEDRGPGIAADHLPHIFERYWQARSGAARSGVGLGLAITSGIVTAQGGTIHVESEVGVGSKFSFTVPRA